MGTLRILSKLCDPQFNGSHILKHYSFKRRLTVEVYAPIYAATSLFLARNQMLKRNKFSGTFSSKYIVHAWLSLINLKLLSSFERAQFALSRRRIETRPKCRSFNPWILYQTKQFKMRYITCNLEKLSEAPWQVTWKLELWYDLVNHKKVIGIKWVRNARNQQNGMKLIFGYLHFNTTLDLKLPLLTLMS